MKSSPVAGTDNATAQQYNDLRSDASGGAQLLVHQQGTPGMTVHVEPGIFFIGTSRITCAGGDTGTFAAPTANPRIDLVTIDNTGTIGTVTGTEAASPSAPAYPGGKVVAAEIYHVVGEAVIYDKDNQTAGQGYITDVRPLISTPLPTEATGLGTYSANTGYQNTSGRPQLHIITVTFIIPESTNGLADAQFLTGPSSVAPVSEAHMADTATTNEIRSIHNLVAFVPPGYFFRANTSVTNTATADIVYWRVITL
jgi:hypothetical protein